MTPRRLVVMRHAKAEPFAATDHDRQLTDRGRADAAAAGRHLAETRTVPDHAVVSTALRTVQTWQELARTSGSTVDPVLDAAVYTGSVDVVLETLRTVPEAATTLVFVGHNPTAAYLAHTLDDGDGEPGAVHGMLRGFPTGALAVLEVMVPWADLAAEAGRLVDFHVARG